MQYRRKLRCIAFRCNKTVSNTLGNLITLCSRCHEAVHKAHKPKPLVKTLSFKPKPKMVLSKPVRLSRTETVGKPKPKPISPLEKKLFQQFISQIKLPEPTKTIFLANLKPRHLDLLFTCWLLNKWEEGGGSLSKLITEILKS